MTHEQSISEYTMKYEVFYFSISVLWDWNENWIFFSHRMMGIARSSVLCFVIDTTGSMSDEIEEARSVVYQIIDAYKGTQDEPSEYILVPFNDPGMNSSIPLMILAFTGI